MTEPAQDTPKATFDLIVLGAGSGGLAGAKRAALRGARVLIIEANRIGGTCVLRGCIPKKIMVYASELGQARSLAQGYGWPTATGLHDWPTLCRGRDSLLERLEAGHRDQLVQAKITIVQGRARFLNSHTVVVGDTSYRGQHFLIATGGQPQMPKLSGIELCLDSDGFFRLLTRPNSVAIVGGGYIAVEFACLLQSLGCQVHMLIRSHLLREFDTAIVAHVRDAMTAAGIQLYENTQTRSITAMGTATDTAMDAGTDTDTATSAATGHGQRRISAVHADAPFELTAQTCVLFATGRRPDTQFLRLGDAGVQVDAKGAIVVDDRHATTAAHIFAVGDVIDRINLTPVAIKAARSVAEALFGGRTLPIHYDNVPTAVFSHPPIGAVGLTEAQARAQYGACVQVYETRFVPLKYALVAADQKVRTIMKLVVHSDTDAVLGFHMSGDDAPEMIQGFAAALQAGITKTQLDSTVAVHPTAAEEFVLMK